MQKEIDLKILEGDIINVFDVDTSKGVTGVKK